MYEYQVTLVFFVTLVCTHSLPLYIFLCAPSMGTFAPFMNKASSEARKMITLEISSAF